MRDRPASTSGFRSRLSLRPSSFSRHGGLAQSVRRSADVDAGAGVVLAAAVVDARRRFVPVGAASRRVRVLGELPLAVHVVGGLFDGPGLLFRQEAEDGGREF